MSLKVMHLVFVSACILLALSLAVWSGWNYAATGGLTYLAGTAGALAAVGALVPYLVWIRHKLRGVGLW